MDSKTADLVVIGAGPGGYVAAIRGAQMGLRVLVVEKEKVGGVCLNWGCIPSKALIQAADAFHRLRKEVPAMGIGGVESPSLDMAKLMAWKQGISDKLTGGVKALLKGNKIELMAGEAKLVSANEIEVATAEGQVMVTSAKGIILAAGGRPIEPPGLAVDGKSIISAKQAVSLSELPGRLAVIGGGVIGLELGTVFCKLGSEVTVVELMPSILPGFEPDVVTICGRRLKQLKIKVLAGAKAAGVEQGADGLALKVAMGDAEQEVACDKVLVAIGMRPNSEQFAGVGIDLDERGFVAVDEHCQTSLAGVYAIGDLTGQPMLAHKASFEGEVAAEAIAGHGERTRNALIPGAVFTDPEIGAVGLTEPAAKEAGYEVSTGRFFFAASGKAMALQETNGLVKVVADAATDKLLGVHIIGPHASDLISEAILAISQGLTSKAVSHIVRAHPTLSEVLGEAVMDVAGMPVHAIRR